MSGHGHQIFTDGLARLATHTAAPGLAALARRVGAPVTVAVHGRHGVGVSTVAAVLTAAGIRVHDADADVDVRVDRRGGQARRSLRRWPQSTRRWWCSTRRT